MSLVRNEPPRFAPAEIVPIILGLMLAMFLASIDQTIVATALSSIAKELDGWESMAWVVSAYLVTSTVTTPIHGRLSDLYGRRPLLLGSIVLFVVASVLCALSQTMPELIAARALQGVGGGGLRAVSQASLADVIPPRDRGRYQGYFATVFSVSNALGPVLGGFFSDYLTWHWIFWINLPLGAGALILTDRSLKRFKKPARRAAIDWLGALLILASTTPILLGVGNAERAGGWLAPAALGPIATGFIMLAALILWERIAKEPMLPLHLFLNRAFTVGILVTFFFSAVMIALVILVPLDFQLVAGTSANEAGIRLVPITVCSVLGSASCGWLVTRTGRYRIYPIGGSLLAALTCAAIAAVGLGHSLAFDIAATSILGFAWGGQFSPITVASQNALEFQDTGIGMSCLLFFRLIGGAFGVALLTTALIAWLNQGALAVPGHEALGANPGLALLHLDAPGRSLPPALAAAFDATLRGAFQRVYALCAGILFVSFLVSLAIKEVPLRGGS